MSGKLRRVSLVASVALAAAIQSGGAFAAVATDAGVDVEAKLERRVLQAEASQTVHVRVALKARPVPGKSRPPLNLSLVIDRSGSMAGPRIEAARRAALDTIDRLGRNDILSVVSYDDRVDIEFPATKLTNPAAAQQAVRRLTPRGSTAIYAGLQAGAEEVRKFKSKDRVNKIILLSDGLANVGRSQPADFAGLGREFASEGITVSTVGLGLGYNEDLMQKLATAADGTHAFIQEPAELAQFLARELDDTLGIRAQDVEIILTCAPGVKPLKSLGREAEIKDSKLVYRVANLVGGAEQVLVAALEVPASSTVEGELVQVSVSFMPAGETQRRTIQASLGATFGTKAQSEASLDEDVVKDVTTLVARAARQEATRLMDAGQIKEAAALFTGTANFLFSQQEQMPSLKSYAPLADELSASKAAAAPTATTANGWAKARKIQRETDSNKAGSSVRY